jgi:hypothetical protein
MRRGAERNDHQVVPVEAEVRPPAVVVAEYADHAAMDLIDGQLVRERRSVP